MVQMTRSASIGAVAELSYLQELLMALEREDSHAARATIALKADHALETIMDDHYLLFGTETREFQSQVLKAYRGFRETHPDIYQLSSNLMPEKKDEWLQRDKALSDYLKSHK
jgi:tRNA(Leu) C34 or U34 (ribose-2'-O)-methylase TrmL